MANSQFITTAKNAIIKEFIKDQRIVDAIHATDVASPEKLKGTHIFDYHQNPNTINKVGTFITIQVHEQTPFYESQAFIVPTIEIWIFSHESHMIVDNIPKVNINRNDYLSQLIDEKLNGKNIGIGGLMLKDNSEGAYQQNYVFRRMLFESISLNDSMCEDE